MGGESGIYNALRCPPKARLSPIGESNSVVFISKMRRHARRRYFELAFFFFPAGLLMLLFAGIGLSKPSYISGLIPIA